MKCLYIHAGSLVLVGIAMQYIAHPTGIAGKFVPTFIAVYSGDPRFFLSVDVQLV